MITYRLNRIQRLAFVLIIILPVIACDQVIKKIVKEQLMTAPIRTYFNDMVRLGYAQNPGSILGLGAKLPAEVRLAAFAIMTACVLIATLVYCLRPAEAGKLQLVGLALLSSGGIGNLIDRVINQGWVVDYLQLRLWRLATGVFNLADVAIFTGILILLYTLLATDQKTANQEIKN